MKPLTMIHRSVPLFCLFALVLCLGACFGQSGPESALPGPNARAQLGNFFLLSPDEDPATKMAPAILLHSGKDITQINDPMREVTADGPLADFPLPGCESMKVEMFTGGANCCFGYYLLTSCPDGEHAGYLEPGNGGVGEAQPALRAYAVDDPTFFYYQPKNQKAASPLFLSRADSPRVNRFLVYDKGLWRADKPGEFPAVYKSLLVELDRDKDMNPTAKAISTAYYSLMAGEKASAIFRELKRALPKEWTPLTNTVNADIRAAVKDFNPVKNLKIGK